MQVQRPAAKPSLAKSRDRLLDADHPDTEITQTFVCDASMHLHYQKEDAFTHAFYCKETVDLAKRLLGQTLVRKLKDGTLLKGTIVETEAYLGVTDASCHCYGGRKTPKTEAMFMMPGTAYVYNVYFQYCCFNISSKGKLLQSLVSAGKRSHVLVAMVQRWFVAEVCSGV